MIGIFANGFMLRRFAAYFERPSTLAACAVGYALSLVAWACGDSAAMITASLVPLVLMSSAVGTVTKSKISQSCGADIVGTVMGVSGALDNVTRITAPPLAGHLFEAVGPPAVGGACALGAVAAGAIFGFLALARKREKVE